jgi:hypothetical protein
MCHFSLRLPTLFTHTSRAQRARRRGAPIAMDQVAARQKCREPIV